MADERIRLVLDVTGVQDMALLKETLAEVTQALGATDSKLEEVTDSAREAADAIDEVNAATGGGGAGGGGAGGGGGGRAGGRRSRRGGGGKDGKQGNGNAGLAQAMMQIGYAADDIQYGFRGIVNNVPMLVQSLGLGMGVAGAIQIVAVVANQYADEIEKLIVGKKKFKDTIETLFDPMRSMAERIEFQKKELEELGKKYKLTTEELNKYRAGLVNVQQQEKELADQRAAQKAAETNAEDKGVADKEKLSKYKAAFDETVTQQGEGKKAQDDLAAGLYRRQMADAEREMSDDDLLKLMESDANFRESVERSEGKYLPKREAVGGQAVTFSEAEIRSAKLTAARTLNKERVVALSNKAREDSKRMAADIIGRMINAKTVEEYNEAFAQLAEISPELAQRIAQQYQWNVADEDFEKDIVKTRESAEKRREITSRIQGPGLDTTAEERDQANARAKETAAGREKAAEDKKNEQTAKSNAEKRKRESEIRDAAVDRAGEQYMQQMGMNPLGLYQESYNSVQGRSERSNQARQQAAIQQRDALANRMSRDTGMPIEDARRFSSEVLRQGERAAMELQRTGQITVNGFGRLAYTARANARAIDNIMRQMNNQNPAWQGGNRPR